MRTILHSDLNAFYASVECIDHPELRDQPLAICGDPEARHGIVLTKNQIAKGYGIQTGDTIWQARQKCPNLVIRLAEGQRYLEYSNRMMNIYADYTDRVEPYGLDEAWLDVSGDKRGGPALADELRRRAREELGLTVSVGVSFNKVFAKLGSDMKKPDATTLITPEDFRRKVWPLPAGALLYVGPATSKRLLPRNLLTIGDVAQCDKIILREALGQAAGETLYAFANGLDRSPVARLGETSVLKSVSNSTTPPRDLATDEDVYRVLSSLADSVGARLRAQGLRCRVVRVSVRDCDLFSFERQMNLRLPTDIGFEIAERAFALFRAHYDWSRPVRSVGVCGSELVRTRGGFEQISFFDDPSREKRRALECCIDALRERFGASCVRRGFPLDREADAPGEAPVLQAQFAGVQRIS